MCSVVNGANRENRHQDVVARCACSPGGFAAVVGMAYRGFPDMGQQGERNRYK